MHITLPQHLWSVALRLQAEREGGTEGGLMPG